MFNCCIRGAITIEENTKENILENTRFLINEIINKNHIYIENIISILFTATKDIDAAYPAIAARQLGITEAGLMCVQEMYVKDSINMCIRVLVNIKTDLKQSQMKHIYLKEAEKLRPDIVHGQKKAISIAIDGPAGSGKSTIAKLIAKQLGYLYVDTGAMYRAVGLYCVSNSIDCNNEKKVNSVIEDIRISFIRENNQQKILLNGRDVTDIIRTQEIAAASSAVATIKQVRERLVEIQRKIALSNNVVMDGRDIGTCVLPNADIKIYMDANIDERAKRRCYELSEKGIEHNFYKVKEEIIKRDENDKNRVISPLKKADDAILIDTSNKDIETVKTEIENLIKQKLLI